MHFGEIFGVVASVTLSKQGVYIYICHYEFLLCHLNYQFMYIEPLNYTYN